MVAVKNVHLALEHGFMEVVLNSVVRHRAGLRVHHNFVDAHAMTPQHIFAVLQKTNLPYGGHLEVPVVYLN